MRIVTNRVLASALLLFTPVAMADELFRTQEKVAGFANHRQNGSVLLVSAGGEAYWMLAGKLVRKLRYRVTDADCVPATQNTAMAGPGMTLAAPFLVGMGRVCLIDDDKKEIRLLSRFGLPENAFSVSYAGQDERGDYFVINGRRWDAEGYLLGLFIEKTSYQVEVREVVTNVPGYSGAMAYEDETLWITVWDELNEIYSVSAAQFRKLMASGVHGAFSAVARRLYEKIDGLSLFVLVNAGSFLYYNEGYESYLVSKMDGQRLGLSPNCEPIAGDGLEWQVLCEGQTFERLSL